MASARFGRVLTAMVTPFDMEGKLNVPVTEHLAKHLINHGSDGIVACGTTGESPALSHNEKLEVIEAVRRAIPRDRPVIAGTGGNDTAASIELTREAAALGADAALLVVPPYNRPSQEGLYQHFRTIAEAVPDLPIILYNVPGRTAQNLEAATTLRLAHDVSNIVAIKEASANLTLISEIVAGAPNGFEVYSGDDGLTLPILAVGGVGVVSVTSHLVGGDIQAMIAAYFDGDVRKAASLHHKMLPLVKACFPPTTPSPAAVKAAVSMLGTPVGGLRLPLVAVNEAERCKVQQALADYGLIP